MRHAAAFLERHGAGRAEVRLPHGGRGSLTPSPDGRKRHMPGPCGDRRLALPDCGEPGLRPPVGLFTECLNSSPWLDHKIIFLYVLRGI